MVTFIRLYSNLILLLAFHWDALLVGVRRKYTYSQMWRTMTWNALEWKHMQAIRDCNIVNLYSVDLLVDRFLCCFSSPSVVDLGSRLYKQWNLQTHVQQHHQAYKVIAIHWISPKFTFRNWFEITCTKMIHFHSIFRSAWKTKILDCITGAGGVHRIASPVASRFLASFIAYIRSTRFLLSLVFFCFTCRKESAMYESLYDTPVHNQIHHLLMN